MKRTYVWRDGKLIEVTPDQIPSRVQIMEDVSEFRSPDGKHIRGRAQWREHLKATDSIEMGHSDVKAAQREWEKKREAFQQKVSRGTSHVREIEPPAGDIHPQDRTRMSCEMANRLYNRPEPDRKTLIKLSLETARYLAKRK